VGDHTISAATVNHWIRIESVTSHGGGGVTSAQPKGTLPVPPEYTDCIAYLVSHTQGGPKPTPGQARVSCAAEYNIFKETILGILISYYWDAEEGAAKGLHIADAEVTQYLKQYYPHPGQFGHFLAISHETLADERLLVRRKLMGAKLTSLSERNTHSLPERVRAISRRISEEEAKWRPQTSCERGYVVRMCKQYRGPQP
jgi:hypothetical protein